jgi:hypothetical protein
LYRERKRLERLTSAGTAAVEVFDALQNVPVRTTDPVAQSVVEDIVDVVPIPLSKPPSNMPELERYVADALLGAEIAYSQASPNATESSKTLASALDNAERYARWRYAGVLDGSVNGL